jgi:hypothetical protein
MTEPLSPDDLKLIESRIDKSWLALLRTYFPFFIALVIANYTGRKKGVRGTIGFIEYHKIYIIVAVFFAAVFIVFLILDFRKRVLPYIKEKSTGEKKISVVRARKYYDPIFKQYLLYHPFKENAYLAVSQQVFDSLWEGQEIELQTGAQTGILLALKINNEVISEVEEYRFR